MNLAEQNWRDLETIWSFLDIKHDLPDKAGVCIVGGSGNLTDGAERAAELYKRGVIPLIVVSGFANPYLGGVIIEADLLSEALISLGVPSEAILREPNAANTAENITKSEELLRDKGINPQKVILIHKPYMTRRFYATALAHWPKPQPDFFSTSKSASLRDYYEYDKRVYGGDGMLIEQMLGDFERIKEYPKRGWMAEQPIPQEAALAYERLVQDGATGKQIT